MTGTRGRQAEPVTAMPPEVHAEATRRFQRAVVRFARPKPWRQAGEFRFARLEGACPHPLFAAFMGAGGGTPALAVFLDEAAVASLMLDREPPPDLPVLLVSFLPPGVSHPRDEKSWRASHPQTGTALLRRWKDDAAPAIDEIVLVAVVLEALAQIDLRLTFQGEVRVGGDIIRLTWPLTPERVEPAH